MQKEVLGKGVWEEDFVFSLLFSFAKHHIFKFYGPDGDNLWPGCCWELTAGRKVSDRSEKEIVIHVNI